MVVDRRHDHSFRIPRPDLSVKLGTPNACNDCHADKSAEWAASAVERWHGPNRKGFQNYAEAFHAAWTGQADAAALLAAIAADRNAPAIARASALSELGSRAVAVEHRSGADGPLRSRPDGAHRRARHAGGRARRPSSGRWPRRCCRTPVRGVRIRAASLLAGGSDRAASRLPTASASSARRPSSSPRRRSTPIGRKRARRSGTFYAQRGATAEAEAEYKAALRLSPQYAPAAINLADLYRQLGREGDGESVLRAAIAASPQDAGLHHALGLTLVRLKRLDEALGELRRAAELAPDQARYAYVYAVALHSAGRGSEAMTVLKDSLARHPDDRDTLLALISFSRDAGEFGTALDYAEQLARVNAGRSEPERPDREPSASN